MTQQQRDYHNHILRLLALPTLPKDNGYHINPPYGAPGPNPFGGYRRRFDERPAPDYTIMAKPQPPAFQRYEIEPVIIVGSDSPAVKVVCLHNCSCGKAFVANPHVIRVDPKLYPRPPPSMFAPSVEQSHHIPRAPFGDNDVAGDSSSSAWHRGCTNHRMI